MRRISAATASMDQGQDSFLDVVANIVGILILLVMVVGVRAARTPAPAETAAEAEAAPDIQQANPADEAKVAQLQRKAFAIKDAVDQLATRIRAAEEEESLREMERIGLSAHLIEFERQLNTRTSQLNAEDQAELELATSLAAAQSKLDDLVQQQLSIEPVGEDDVEQIQSLPTPLAQTVEGEELHLRLRQGMVSVIPLDELLGELKQRFERIPDAMSDRDELIDTVGPYGGYRLRYRIVKGRVVLQTAAGPLNRGQIIRLDRWELLPMANDLGQSVSQALMPGSELRRALSLRRPQDTTVTIWTYPDSFGEFRQLKQALFQAGYATAARPLPDHIRIGGSPQGTKSAAQ